MEGLAEMITKNFEKISTPANSSELDFPNNKERISVGTDAASAFTFKLDYTSTGRFECCMSRDKRALTDDN